MGPGLHRTSSATSLPTGKIGAGHAAEEAQNVNDTGMVTFTTPDLPDAPQYTTSQTPAPHPSMMGTLVGRMKPAVAGVLVAATLGAGCASAGPPVQDITPEMLSPAPIELVQEAPAAEIQAPRGGLAAFNQDMEKLEQMEQRGEISADQLARARAVLHRAKVLGFDQGVARDERGRITVESVLRGAPTTAAVERGQQVLDQLNRDLEMRMRITARDMAYGDFTEIDGAPGYKEIPAKDVRRLLTRAFKRMPIGTLPFGAELTQMLGGLPGLEGDDVGSMSYEEVRRELRDEAKDRFDARFGDFIDDHKIEVGVVAFAAVTGLRAASPEAADLIDGLGLKVDAWKERSDDGNLYTRGRLVWRDQHVFPDLDIEGRALHPIGDQFTLRGVLRGTASFEAEDPFTATATVGARYTGDKFWLDSAGTYMYPEDRWRASVTGGYADPDTTFRASGGLRATFGDGIAQGDAEGRGTLQLDLGQDLDFGGNTKGYWGFYGGISADTDMENKDYGVGVVFRLDF